MGSKNAIEHLRYMINHSDNAEMQKAELNASLGGMDNLFASEGKRQQKNRAEKEAALRKKACESKNRYTSKSDAEVAITSCASYGTTGLHSYRCPYCNGWHLTSKPERKQ